MTKNRYKGAYGIGKFNYWNYDLEIRSSDGQLALSKYLGSDKVIYIPEDIVGKSIVKITSKSFQNNKCIKIVILNDRIKDIAHEAFLGTEDVVLYTPFEKEECNFDQVANVIVRYGLRELVSIEYIHYAVFTNEVVIYDHCTLDLLRDSQGRMGEDLMLEEMVKGKPVTIIESHGLKDMFNIRRLLLPTYLTEILQYGLANATMLEYIHFNDQLTHIHHHALEGCRELGLVIIQKSIESISNDSFNKCPKATIFLDSIHFVDLGINWNGNTPYYEEHEKTIMVDYTEYSLLKDGRAILIKGYVDYPAELVIPELISDEGKEYKVTEISAGAFENTRNLNAIVLPKSIEKIYHSALKNTSIKEIIIPEKVTTIAESVLEGNLYLEKVVLEGEVTEIEERAFAENPNLVELKLPNTIKRIGVDCLLNCESIVELELPEELEKLSEGALLGTNVDFILVPLGVKKLEAFVFGAMTNLKKIILLNDEIVINDNWITEFGDIDIYYFGKQRIKFESRLKKLSNGGIKFHLIPDEIELD